MPRLSIRDLSVQVHLGCTAQERGTQQEILVSCEMYFREAPPACQTDRLQDTLCFAEISDRIREAVTSKEFHTVEYLGAFTLNELEKYLKACSSVVLQIHKIKAPIRDLRGGTVFTLERNYA